MERDNVRRKTSNAGRGRPSLPTITSTSQQSNTRDSISSHGDVTTIQSENEVIGSNDGHMQIESSEIQTEGNPHDSVTHPNNKRTRSSIWNHFSKLYDSEGNETGRAECVWCGKDYQGKSDQGTSGLWKHLRETCRKFPDKKALVEAHRAGKDKSQSTLTFQKGPYGDKQLTAWTFDQQTSREALVKMIIRDELAFRFIERPGFRHFVETICPNFVIPSRFTIARDCYKLFVNEKKKLKAFIVTNCQRVSLTTDTWTSIQNLSYLCLTAHFIDNEWNLHKKILNFCVIKSHKGVNIGNAIDFCMEEWGISKVMCITVDNASSNDTAVIALKKKLMKKDAFVLGGDAFHMRCCAHILQLIVRDGMDYVGKAISKIRNVIRYIRSSPQRKDLFRQCCDKVNITSKASLCLDCPTRWNSTYHMLQNSVGYQEAFEKIQEVDHKLTIDFGEELPSEVDWDNARRITRFLRKFYEVTCKISGTLYSTSNLFFPEIIKILRELELCESASDSELSNMGNHMRAKFDKYWGSLDKMNVMLFVAVVLDPRYKVDYLNVKYTEHYDHIEAKKLIFRVKRAVHDMINEYKAQKDQLGSTTSKAATHITLESNTEDEDIDPYFIQKAKQNQLVEKSELDIYLDEREEPFVREFNLLEWWKVNAVRFPLLSKVAKDVLAVQCSTVASESAFSTGGRTLDQFRSSLTPTTAEVLICCQDWLRGSNQPITLEETLSELENFEDGVLKEPDILENVLPRTLVDA